MFYKISQDYPICIITVLMKAEVGMAIRKEDISNTFERNMRKITGHLYPLPNGIKDAGEVC